MAKALVIVESPAKAKTIGKFLGRNYTVKASMGHIRDLPRSQFGVDIDKGFAPRYITIRGKGPVLAELRKDAKKVDQVLLATDPDREGEAISWHLAEALGLDGTSPCRIEFHEITKNAIQNAVRHPRKINGNLVDAQQARRVLDRIVGYELSPLLWAKVRKGLSAGRVQSVALRLIVDREAEIEAFEPEEYWTIDVILKAAKGEFSAELRKRDGKKIKLGSESDATAVVNDLKKQSFEIASVKRTERRRNPTPPFTTSSLQQEASKQLGFPTRKTMRIAQQLYEGLEVGEEGTVGLITYIRTDATRVADEAVSEARDLIRSRFGKDFTPAKPPVYKSKEGAQAAHEAIRPTSSRRTPEIVKPFLSRDQYRLYELIWRRFVASQMSAAVFDVMSVDIKAGPYDLRAVGSRLKFSGFLKVYSEEPPGKETLLPPLTEGESLTPKEVRPEQHFTQPPPRYTEASLVKAMEELRIGRPSTYSPTIETILKRGYVALEDKRFKPTELGVVVTQLLKEHFQEIIDVDFTASMEEQLDQIEEGKANWQEVLETFYEPFSQRLDRARNEMEEVVLEDEVTEEKCQLCGRNMVIKHGRYGKFLACPGFPECRNTKPILEEIGVKCPKCGRAIVKRRTKRGRVFYGCSGYPDCDFTSWQEPVGRTCPQCGGTLVLARKKGHEEIVCSEKGCHYSEGKKE